ncbi:response regulator [candidate division WWE3 bacterium]|uniref:Response regulator n=1 Tax=candidate division WWE3 bacterium TaxID=2053526 RepID=A0A955RQD6_UNCKA|nr:response regulator [candidate division WWE3 bacterium]
MAEESKQYTVLVVEDELPLQRIVEQKLKAKGFLVKTANSVNQALEILQEADDIDVIWLDHYLYGTEDGLGMIVELKSEGSHWRRIPVFVVSNTVGGDKARMYLRLGAEKFYTKANHKLEDIITDIQNHLSGVTETSTDVGIDAA